MAYEGIVQLDREGIMVFRFNGPEVIGRKIRSRTLNCEYEESGGCSPRHGGGTGQPKCIQELEVILTEIPPVLMSATLKSVLDSPPKHRRRKRHALANNNRKSKTESEPKSN